MDLKFKAHLSWKEYIVIILFWYFKSTKTCTKKPSHFILYICFCFSHLTKIFVEAYNVLYTYLMGDSRKNELYIAKYIDFFLSQFELKEVSNKSMASLWLVVNALISYQYSFSVKIAIRDDEFCKQKIS